MTAQKGESSWKIKRGIRQLIDLKKIINRLSIISIAALIFQTAISASLAGYLASFAKPVLAITANNLESKCVWWELVKIDSSWQWSQNTSYNITKEWCDGKSQPPSRNSVYTPAATGIISGYKYEDRNNNGIDGNDLKLSGWEIILSGDKSQSTTTDINGYYSFSGLMPGNYNISEGIGNSGNFRQTYPLEGSHAISLAEGENITGKDFANYLPSCNNGIFDAGFINYAEICEIGISQNCTTADGYGGRQSCAPDCLGWQSCISQETCGDGIQNGPEQCDDGNNVDSDGCSKTCMIEKSPDPVCGNNAIETNEQCDDGNLADNDGCSSTCQIEPNKSTISGYKYYDKNRSNSVESGDETLGGWNIKLEEFNGQTYIPKAENLTNIFGYYQFSELNPGRYRVAESFVGKDNWTATYPNASGYYEIDVIASSRYENIDFADYMKFCGNGIKDENESCDGADGVPVNYTCSSQCTLDYIPYCGDGIKNGSEECDGIDGIMNDQSCSNQCKMQNAQNNGNGSGSSGSGRGSGGSGAMANSFSISQETVRFENLSDESVAISWLTSHFSSSRVIYSEEGEKHDLDMNDSIGDTPTYGYAHTTPEYDIDPKVTWHSVVIKGLKPEVKYYYRTISRGSFAMSNEHEFTLEKASPAAENLTAAPMNVTDSAQSIDPICKPYLSEFIRLGGVNNGSEALKLEKFLNKFEGESLVENGIFEKADSEAVSRFQIKYKEDILGPWNGSIPTGNVFTTTMNKINEIYCNRYLPLTSLQLAEISATKARLASTETNIVSENAANEDFDVTSSENEDTIEPALDIASVGNDAGEVKGASAKNTDEKIAKGADSATTGIPKADSKTAEYQSYVNYVLIFMIIVAIIYAYGYFKKDNEE